MRSATCGLPLKHALVKQWQGDRARQDQLSALAPDLKMPLRPLRQYGIAVGHCALRWAKKCADYRERGSMQMQGHVQTLLAVTKSWDGEPHSPRQMPVDFFWREVQNQIDGLCRRNHVPQHWDCGRYPQSISANQGLRIRALVNVGSNAAEHTPRGGTVCFEAAEEGSTDSGGGVTGEAIQHATEPFFADDGSRSARPRDGIGLSVAASVVQNHHGRPILERAESTGGAMIGIQLPCGSSNEDCEIYGNCRMTGEMAYSCSAFIFPPHWSGNVRQGGAHMARLLIVEDDRRTNEAICEYLRPAGHQVAAAYDGMEALQRFQREGADLIVLDIMLPRMSGLSVLQEIRRTSTVPILMLTALEDETTQIVSFDAQADDYLTKPFSMVLLGKRITALLRRSGQAQPPDCMTFGDVTVHFSGYTASDGNGKIDVTPKEIDLLRLLVEHKGLVLTRSQILDDLWGDADPIIDRTVDTYIKNLRKKLRLDCIVTVKGIGYKYEVAT